MAKEKLSAAALEFFRKHGKKGRPEERGGPHGKAHI
jgi:hypothetical protein